MATVADRVSVIVPTRDSARHLATLLDGLARSSWPDLEVILVDNGTRDLRALAVIADSGAVVVRRDIPFSFSRLVNAGAAAATGEFLLLLNDDVEVIDPGWIEGLVDAARRPEVGPVGALLLFSDGSVQHCGIARDNGSPYHPAAGLAPDQAPPDLVRGCSPRWAVTGACFMVRATLFAELGGLEPLLAVVYNDVDFCLRAARRGLTTFLNADVRLIHHESATRGTTVTPEVEADWFMFRTRWADALSQSGAPASAPD